MFTYKVFDDFIPSYHQNCIEKECQNINWQYNPNISAVPFDPSGMAISRYQGGFSGNIYSETGQSDLLMGLCLPMVAKASEYLEERLSLRRIRAGMFLRGEGLHKPHVDYYEPHYTLLYYVNDSDGDTFIFNNIASDMNYPDEFSLMERISPRKGRVVIFNGLLYHCSSYPEEHDTRLAININLMNA